MRNGGGGDTATASARNRRARVVSGMPAMRTLNEGEVQEFDCVRCTKPDFDRVIGPQVPIHDPPVLR